MVAVLQGVNQATGEHKVNPAIGAEPWPVLVVEDDHEIRESLVDILGDQSISVIAAVNGRDGLNQLVAHHGKVRLVLLDMMMPVLDGDGFREEQTSDPRFASLPVVVMSAYRDVAAAAQRLGAAGYLKKPFSVSDVLDAIRVHSKQS